MTASAAHSTAEQPRRRLRRRSASGRGLWSHAARLESGMLAVIVSASALAVGTVHTPTLLTLALLVGCAVVVSKHAGHWPRRMPAVGLAALLGSYSLAQAAPVPLSVLSRVAPANADVWRHALEPLGESVTWGSVSLDPPASIVEALKWFVYAGVFGLSAAVGRRRGAPFIAALLLGSALLVAAVTLAHGLASAENLYGVYRPISNPMRWATAPLLNPNNLSGYFNLGAFAGLGLLVSSSSPRSRWMVGLGTAWLVGQSVLTASRGGVLTLLLGWLGCALVLPRLGSSRTGWVWPALGVLAGGLLAALLGAQQTTWGELLQDSSDKLAILGWSLPFITSHPWFGVGAGAFETAFPAYRVEGGPLWSHPENFVIAWVSEWGVLVGVCAVAGLCWTFRPRALGAHRSRLVAALYIGIAVLCLQNLADLAFAVPGVFVACAAALGGLWGAFQTSTPAAPSPPPGAGHRGPLRWLLPGGLPVCVGATALFGLSSAAADREALARAYQRAQLDQAPDQSTFYAELRAALLRHPGDPFLPRLGALAAAQTPGGNPLSWAARALRRDPQSGPTHLLLAELLAQRGQVTQALLHLRLGAETDSALTEAMAGRALVWAERSTEVWRAVPGDEAGTPMLLALARRLDPQAPNEAALRRDLLKAALDRAPSSTDAHAMVAEDLLTALARGKPPCATSSAECSTRIERHLDALRLREPSDARQIELRGWLRALDGDPAAAVTFLLDECPRSRPRCLRRAVQLSAETPDLPLDPPARAYLAAVCGTNHACASASLWIGDRYRDRQLWRAALAHYGRAGELAEDAASWLRVARAASRLGAHQRALQALRRAENLVGTGDAELLEAIAAERQLVLAQTGADLP